MTESRKPWHWAVDSIIVLAIAVLLFNPRGIVGRWIADIYEKRQEKQRISEIWLELSGAESRIGTGDKSRTVVEFIDYQCPSCRAAAQSISDDVANRGVTAVFRHYPLTQIHPVAHDAALASICAERYGLFAQMHRAMMENDTWIDDQDWSDLALQVGIAEEDGFEECMAEDETLERLRYDMELADSLGIRGTPSFVTPEEIFLGAGGWVQALGTLPEDVTEPESMSIDIFDLSEDTLFDSYVHPNEAITLLANLRTAMFLKGDRLLIQDRYLFHFVEVNTGKVTTIGGQGAGPGEFQAPLQAVRSANGIVIWDLALGRLTTLSDEGEYVGSRHFDIAQLRSPVAPLVAAFEDGSVVFRDDSTSAFGIAPNGLYREPVRYVRISPDGSSVVIHNARSVEAVHEEPMYASIIFSHNVLDATLGNSIVVAQTDLPAISVFDSNGVVVSQLPMPEMIDVSRNQIEIARDSAIEDERRRTSRLSRRLGYPIDDDLLSHDIPVNDPAPPIDKVFSDLDGRVWLRKYQLPDETIAKWEAWTVDDVKLDVRLDIQKMDGTLLDIDGNKALFHVQDDFDVDRVIVRRIRIVE